jgi:hypothetical protein
MRLGIEADARLGRVTTVEGADGRDHSGSGGGSRAAEPDVEPGLWSRRSISAR